MLELPSSSSSSSAAITALLISGLFLCVPVHAGGAKGAPLRKTMVSCPLLDVKPNCTGGESRALTPVLKELFSCVSSSRSSAVKKEKQPPSPDDVIVLSDNEPSSPLMNGHCFTKTDTDKLMVGATR